jgi:hypothetical protein
MDESNTIKWLIDFLFSKQVSVHRILEIDAPLSFQRKDLLQEQPQVLHLRFSHPLPYAV